MKKTIIIITCFICVLLIGCQTDPVPTPNPNDEPTDTIVDPNIPDDEPTDTIVDPNTPDEDPCDAVCDSCPPYYYYFYGWLQYFEHPIIMYGINTLYPSTIHAILVSDVTGTDTIGFINEEMIPECLRKEEKTHVKACVLHPLGPAYDFNNMRELYCIEKMDE